MFRTMKEFSSQPDQEKFSDLFQFQWQLQPKGFDFEWPKIEMDGVVLNRDRSKQVFH